MRVPPLKPHGAHPNRALEEKIQAAYNTVPEHIREDVFMVLRRS
jgi:hypothetical protein